MEIRSINVKLSTRLNSPCESWVGEVVANDGRWGGGGASQAASQQ